MTATWLEQALKVCATCGVEKPEMSFRPSKGSLKRRSTCRKCEKNAASPESKARTAEWQRIRRQRQALERKQNPVDKPDKPGNAGDLYRWGAAAFEPAGTPPLQHPWEVACAMCGQVDYRHLTDEQAKRLSLIMAARRARCQRCQGGWLTMSRGVESVAEAATDFYRGAWYSPDKLDGPQRERKADAA